MSRIDWSQILASRKDLRTVRDWSTGNLSTPKVRSEFAGTERGSEFNRVISTYGVQYGRRLARKALRRRGVNV